MTLSARDADALHRWIADHVDALVVPAPGGAELRHEVISGGASNLTIGGSIVSTSAIVDALPGMSILIWVPTTIA